MKTTTTRTIGTLDELDDYRHEAALRGSDDDAWCRDTDAARRYRLAMTLSCRDLPGYGRTNDDLVVEELS